MGTGIHIYIVRHIRQNHWRTHKEESIVDNSLNTNAQRWRRKVTDSALNYCTRTLILFTVKCLRGREEEEKMKNYIPSITFFNKPLLLPSFVLSWARSPR